MFSVQQKARWFVSLSQDTSQPRVVVDASKPMMPINVDENEEDGGPIFAVSTHHAPVAGKAGRGRREISVPAATAHFMALMCHRVVA
jgi:hypothetical protein